MDSLYGIGDPEWIAYDFRGYDAGTSLKTTSGWNYYGNGTDLFGFSGLPGGSRDGTGSFYAVGYFSDWWTSTENYDYDAWRHGLSYGYPGVYRNRVGKGVGFSVRCLRDN